MLPAGVALVLVGVVFLFVIPWAGIVVGPLGLLLLVTYLVGAGRRVREPRP